MLALNRRNPPGLPFCFNFRPDVSKSSHLVGMNSIRIELLYWGSLVEFFGSPPGLRFSVSLS